MATDPRDTQEFVQLLIDHQEIVRAYIIGQLPGCSEVRDILQEVNILLWEKKDDFKLGTNFGAWACTVAYYMVCNYRRKQKRDGFLVFSDEISKSLLEESVKQIPEELEAKRGALMHCLGKLQEKDRALLSARYNSASGGMDLISAETGRTRESLRVSLTRLRSNLRNCINSRLTIEGGAA